MLLKVEGTSHTNIKMQIYSKETGNLHLCPPPSTLDHIKAHLMQPLVQRMRPQLHLISNNYGQTAAAPLSVAHGTFNTCFHLVLDHKSHAHTLHRLHHVLCVPRLEVHVCVCARACVCVCVCVCACICMSCVHMHVMRAYACHACMCVP